MEDFIKTARIKRNVLIIRRFKRLRDSKIDSRTALEITGKAYGVSKATVNAILHDVNYAQYEPSWAQYHKEEKALAEKKTS